MDRTGKIILVVGATGRQGGAVTRHLIARGWQVRALVRNPHRPEVESLRQRGVEIVEGDLYDRASLERAETSMACTACRISWSTASGRIRQGRNVADVGSGVQHLVWLVRRR